MSTITPDLISSRNVYSPVQMMNILPNINVERTTKGAFQCISIRGFSASNNLVLIDGIPINTGFANWGNILSFPMNDIKKIEVIKGSNSIIYGPNALGGVINIITEKGEGKPSLSGEMKIGNYNFERYRASFEGGGNFNYSINISKNKDGGYLPNTDFTAKHLSAKIGFSLKNSIIHLNTGYIDANSGIPIDPNTPQRVDYWRGLRGSISLETTFPSLGSISFKAYSNSENYKILIYEDTTFTAIKKDLLNRGKTYGGEILGNFLISSSLLTAGIQAKVDNVDFAYVGGKRKASVYGGFLQDLITYRNILAFNMGVRADYHSISGDQFNYSFGFVLYPSNISTVRFSFGTASRFPAIRELYMTSPAPGRGNINLKTERCFSFEGGLDLFLGIGDLSFSYFHTEARNLIERDLTQSPWVFANINSVRMQGVEVEFTKDLYGFKFFFNFSYLEAMELDGKRILNFRPKYKANMGINYSLWKLNFSIVERYTGKQFYTVKDPSTGERVEKTIDDYLLTEIKVILNYPSFGKLSLSVDNLFNEKYEIEAHQQALPVIPGEPRRFTFGFEI